MHCRQLILLLVCVSGVMITSAQRIVYSEYDKDDTRRMNFEIIGKMGNNYLIYKNTRSENFICVYDNDMKLVEKVKHEYMPDERLINVDFFPYQDFVYMIYQYQKRNIVHCAAVKLDAMGKKMTEPVELDTSLISGMNSNKIYTTLSSEDKQRIILFKINSKNREKYLITTKLYNDNLELLKRSAITMPMEERNDYLGEFAVDNEGNLVFTKFHRTSNENISKAWVVVKKAMEDEFLFSEIKLDDIYLDELRVKVDNHNKKYYLNAFYYKQKRGPIDGLYFRVMEKDGAVTMENTLVFSEELRRDARGDANVKMAFNDYFIRNIITKRDGGFLVDAESFYTTSRGSVWNRWDYMYGSPYVSPFDYYYYSPYYSSWWWRSRWNNNPAVRYHADNIVVFSFDKTGQLQWANVVRKGQFDDDSDDRISYYVMNTGGQLHFLFNQLERRNQLLNDYALSPDGQITRNPTLKNLDKGYEFMPKYGKQVSAKQIIVPCFIRNYICFAKIDFS